MGSRVLLATRLAPSRDASESVSFPGGFSPNVAVADSSPLGRTHVSGVAAAQMGHERPRRARRPCLRRRLLSNLLDRPPRPGATACRVPARYVHIVVSIRGPLGGFPRRSVDHRMSPAFRWRSRLQGWLILAASSTEDPHENDAEGRKHRPEVRGQGLEVCRAPTPRLPRGEGWPLFVCVRRDLILPARMHGSCAFLRTWCWPGPCARRSPAQAGPQARPPPRVSFDRLGSSSRRVQRRKELAPRATASVQA